ncbi:MAG: nucleoside triphosphate pyrophosphohydrolase [Actinobacteria bacterium]|nr:nucleoside triphosphate pyrophosphohydrolase [Actinomycetota bacterium]
MKFKKDKKYTFEDLLDIIAHLRGPNGCIWDKEQTSKSIKKNLIEESYEVVDAIDRDDSEGLKEELGDLLLLLVFHAQIANEEGKFDIYGIIDSLANKLIRRHPHIFSDVNVKSSKEILRNWEKIKEQEKKSKKEKIVEISKTHSTLPALQYAHRLQERAARVGFDWDKKEDLLPKLKEEISELEKSLREKSKDLADELGDLLFTIVNIARRYRIDSEDVLRKSSKKFKDRFDIIKKLSKEQGNQLEELSLDEKEVLWQKAKKILESKKGENL